MTDEGSARRRRWLVPGVLALLGIGAAAVVVRQNRIEAARDPWLDPIPAPTPIRSLRPPTTPIGGDGAALNGTASLNGTETTAVRPAPPADRAEPEPEPDVIRDTAEDEVPAPDAAARTTPDPDATGATDAARGTGAVVGTDAARDPDAEGDTGTGSGRVGGAGAASKPALLGNAEPASAESPPSEAADRTQAAADETLADGDHATPGVRMSEPEPTAEPPASTEPASERLAAGDADGAAPTGKHAAEGPAAGQSATDRAGAAKHAADESDAPGADEPGSLFEPAPGTPAATPTPPERSLKTADEPAEAIAEAPYGTGSALPLEGGGAPSPAYTIKGSAGSKRFHGPTSPYYARTRAEVWFTTPEAAEAAGFTSYKAKRRDGE